MTCVIRRRNVRRCTRTSAMHGWYTYMHVLGWVTECYIVCKSRSTECLRAPQCHHRIESIRDSSLGLNSLGTRLAGPHIIRVDMHAEVIAANPAVHICHQSRKQTLHRRNAGHIIKLIKFGGPRVPSVELTFESVSTVTGMRSRGPSTRRPGRPGP